MTPCAIARVTAIPGERHGHVYLNRTGTQLPVLLRETLTNNISAMFVACFDVRSSSIVCQLAMEQKKIQCNSYLHLGNIKPSEVFFENVLFYIEEISPYSTNRGSEEISKFRMTSTR